MKITAQCDLLFAINSQGHKDWRDYFSFRSSEDFEIDTPNQGERQPQHHPHTHNWWQAPHAPWRTCKLCGETEWIGKPPIGSAVDRRAKNYLDILL